MACVVHLAPPELLGTPAYRAWAARFDPGATHLLAGLPGGRGQPVMRCSAAVQARLNTLDGALFPLQRSLAEDDGEAESVGGADAPLQGTALGAVPCS